jgi:hypothetical protein
MRPAALFCGGSLAMPGQRGTGKPAEVAFAAKFGLEPRTDLC